MDIPVTRKMLSPNQIKISEQIAEKAIEEKIVNGAVRVICPWCKESPNVEILGLNKERITVRCKCGFVSGMELGI